MTPRALVAGRAALGVAAALALGGASACDLSGLGPLPGSASSSSASAGGAGSTSASGSSASAGAAGGVAGAGGGAAMRAWPDSPTAFCSDGTQVVDCASAPGGPQDGTRTDLAAASYRYLDVNLQAVEDRVTGLVWTAFPQGGMTVVLSDAAGVCAATATAKLGGVNDWRLPTRLELSSLLDSGASGPKISTKFHVTDGAFWTSTPSTITSGSTWTVYFPTGDVGVTDNAQTGRVFCVSGALAPSTFVSDALTVIDPRTGLMWQRAPGNGSSGGDWSGARAYCASLGSSKFAGFTGWRLPTAKELETIVDDTKTTEPLIRDGLSWPPGGAQHWSSTPLPDDPTMVYVMVGAGTQYFGDASASGTYLNARCVRSVHDP